MKEPDNRPASHLRFSKDEMPEETTDTKPKRKVRWQLDSPADAAQNVVSQPSVSQMDENFTQRVNDAKAPDSDIMCEPDILAEYGHEPLPRGNATPHMSGDASTRPLFTRTKKRPTSKPDESQPRKATLSFEENAPKQPSKMKHQPQHRVSALVSDSLHRETLIAAVLPTCRLEQAANSCTARPPAQPLAIRLQVVCIPDRGIAGTAHLLAVIPCPKPTRSDQSGRDTSLQEAARQQAEPTRRRRAQRQQPRKQRPQLRRWEKCSSERKAALSWCC